MIKLALINDVELQKDFIISNIKFDDNINILFSSNPNELNKNSLFDFLAKSAGIDSIVCDGGWSQLENITESSQNKLIEKIIVHWSGKPVLYINGSRMNHNALNYYMGSNEFSGIDDVKLLEYLFGFNQPLYVTAGKLIGYIRAVIEHKKIPYLSNDDMHLTKNNVYNKIVKEFKENYPDTISKPLLLLNHIDNGFDLNIQKEFHKVILPELAEHFQIIASSYSVFALEHKNRFDLDGKLKETFDVL